MEIRLELLLVVTMISIGLFTGIAFADSVEWKSEYTVGILNQEPDSPILIEVTTFSQDSLKLEWKQPEIKRNEIISGYKILRKEMNSNYQVVVENTNSKDTTHIDKHLPDGYYAYKIIPIIDQKESDEITMHGIKRTSSLFHTYLKGQELLAKQIWDSQKIQSEIPDSYTIKFKEIYRINNPVFQSAIIDEIMKAKQIFIEKFDVKFNH